MRILTVHLHDDRYQLGGADRGVLDLVSVLRATGSQVRILANRGPFLEEAGERSLPAGEIPHSKLAVLQTLAAIGREMDNFHPDIIHSHHRYTTFLLDIFFKGRKIPVLHTQRVQASDKKLFFRYGTYMTTVSESLRRHMINFYGVPDSKVEAVVNAVSLRKPDAQVQAQLRGKYPRKNGQVFALCTGRFHEQKGHSYLVDAVSKLEEAHRVRLKIFLAGDGPLEEAIRKQISAKNLNENFIFTGYTERIPEFLELCDFLVLPSLWEGLPRVVLESFAAGRPALATSVPGTVDVVEHLKNGYLAKASDPDTLAEGLTFFLDHPDRLEQMKSAAAESSKKYSFETMVEKYRSLYRKLAGKS